MTPKPILALLTLAAALAAVSVAQAKTVAYSGSFPSDSGSFVGANVQVDGKGDPKKISIGFSSAEAPCEGAVPQIGQVGGIQNAKVKEKSGKLRFKGTGIIGPGESTIEGTFSANGKKIKGTADYETMLGTVKCGFSNRPFTVKLDGDQEEGTEND